MKTMKMKKLLAGICTGALALSLVTPAFADSMSNPTSTEFTGTAAPTTVSVKVLAGVKKLYVNPYGMSYTLDDGVVKPAGTTGTLASGDTVIKETAIATGFFSNTAVIENNGNTDLPVSVTLTSKAPADSNAAVAAAAPSAGNNIPNTLVGNFEITDAEAVTGTVGSVSGVIIVTPDWESNKKQTAPIPAVTGDGNGTNPVLGTPTTTDTGYTVSKVTTTQDALGQEITTPGYAAFRLTGNAYLGTDATGKSIAWDADDLIDVVVAFSFGASQGSQGNNPPALNPAVSAAITSGTPAANTTLTLTASLTDIDSSKNPTYSWAVTTDDDSIVDGFSDSNAATQTVNIASGATTGQSAILTVTVNYDEAGTGDGEVTGTVTIAIP